MNRWSTTPSAIRTPEEFSPGTVVNIDVSKDGESVLPEQSAPVYTAPKNTAISNCPGQLPTSEDTSATTAYHQGTVHTK